MADALLARKACRKSVIVDLAAVAVRKKPDGSDRYVSAAFARLQKQLEANGERGAVPDRGRRRSGARAARRSRRRAAVC